MGWDLTGARVEGRYLGDFPYTGTITDSRVKYGGRVQHTVRLDAPIEVYGACREVILVDEGDVYSYAE